MYQVSWAINNGDNNIEDFFLFTDTYEEAQDHVARLMEHDGVHHWTVSMVLEGSDPQHAEVYPEDPDERVLWQQNAIRIAEEGKLDVEDRMVRAGQVMRAFAMLPPRLHDEELFATIMNMAHGYIKDEDTLREMFSACVRATSDVVDVHDRAKRVIN